MADSDPTFNIESHLGMLLNFIDEAVLLTDQHGSLVFVSPNAARVIGCLPGDAHPEGHVARLLGSLPVDPDELRARGEIRDLEQPIVDAAGSLRLLLVHVKLLAERDDARLYICRDISEERQHLEDMRQFRRAVEQSPSTVVITDTQGHITYVNPKFTSLTGYTPEEVIGKNPRVLKSGHTSDEEYARLWRTISSGGEWRGEFLNKKKNDDLYWESASISPITNTRGEITHYVAIKEDITQRKAAERALRESEARYQALFNRTSDAVFLVDLTLRQIGANRQAAAMLGYSVEEMIGRPISEFVMPDDWEAMLRDASKLLAGEIMPMVERRFRHKDGHVVIGEVNATLVYGENDQPSHVHSIVRDITRRKAVEAALQDSESTAREFQEYLKRLHEAYLELARIESLDDLYRRAVQIGIEHLGFDRLGLILIDKETGTYSGTYGTDPQRRLRDEHDYYGSLESKAEWVQPVIRGEDRVVLRQHEDLPDYGVIVGRGWHALAALWDGAHVIGYLSVDNLVHQQPSRPYEADLLSFYGATVGQLIARLRAEEELRAGERRFRTLLEAAPVGILIVDVAGQITSANAIAEAQFGYPRPKLESLTLEDLMPAQSRSIHQQHRAEFFAEPKLRSVHMGVGLDLYGERADGSQFPIEVALSHLELDGSILGVAFVTDIAERRHAQQQQIELRMERERMDILAHFIRNAAHEFRTPLSIINTTLYLMGKVSDEGRQVEMRQRIQEHADNITRLVDSLTTMVRLDSDVYSERLPVDASSILRAALEHARPMMDAKEIQHEFRLMDQLACVNADSSDLALALEHILENAVRYTPNGGRIVVTSACQDRTFVITIKDTGIGMTPDVLARIFERFYRADYARTTRGFGLGLSIAQRIIEYHDGTITAESTPGVGSTFVVRLPLAD